MECECKHSKTAVIIETCKSIIKINMKSSPFMHSSDLFHFCYEVLIAIFHFAHFFIETLIFIFWHFTLTLYFENVHATELVYKILQLNSVFR